MKLNFCISLAALCFIGCNDNFVDPSVGDRTSSITNSVEPSRSDNAKSFGEFSFSIPDGWTIVAPDRDKTKAMLLLDGTNWQNAKAMIKVDVVVPKAPSATKIAEMFASNVGGNVSEDFMEFDGESGVLVSTTSVDLATPRNMFVIFRDGKAYLLMAGAASDIDLSDAVSSIRSSWKWTAKAQ
ncbi:MAG: hypothetical protein R3C03_13750 [Pirellulaceae bacterium]